MIRKRKVEDYMRVVYSLLSTKGTAKGADIARHFGVSKPTVSESLKALADEGYLKKLSDHSVVLTDKGMEIARRITERNNGIYRLLTKLGVNEATAVKDACNMEHVISHESFAALVGLIGENG